MISKLLRLITGSTVALAVVLGLNAGVVFAAAETQTDTTNNTTSTVNIPENLCAGANLNINTGCNTGGLTDKEADEKVNKLIKTIINIFTFVVGVVSVIMIIIGGFKYITSGGDSGNVTGAKNTIMYAIIGLVVVALAQVIVRFVLKQVTTSVS
jgi:cytochrome bd-type quinol oxidase subunit 2